MDVGAYLLLLASVMLGWLSGFILEADKQQRNETSTQGRSKKSESLLHSWSCDDSETSECIINLKITKKLRPIPSTFTDSYRWCVTYTQQKGDSETGNMDVDTPRTFVDDMFESIPSPRRKVEQSEVTHNEFPGISYDVRVPTLNLKESKKIGVEVSKSDEVPHRLPKEVKPNRVQDNRHVTERVPKDALRVPKVTRTKFDWSIPLEHASPKMRNELRLKYDSNECGNKLPLRQTLTSGVNAKEFQPLISKQSGSNERPLKSMPSYNLSTFPNKNTSKTRESKKKEGSPPLLPTDQRVESDQRLINKKPNIHGKVELPNSSNIISTDNSTPSSVRISRSKYPRHPPTNSSRNPIFNEDIFPESLLDKIEGALRQPSTK